MKIVFYTNKGPVREHNEDAVFAAGSIISGCSMALPAVIEGESLNNCFVVIDGMGGYEGGEKAARIVASSFISDLDAEDWNITAKIAQEKIVHILKNSAQRISEIVKIKPQYSSMGAALAGIIFCSDAILVFNCGDCRVYLQQGEYLEKLTHDHSIVQELYDRGDITEDDMRKHPQKNVITACVSSNVNDINVFFRIVSIPQQSQRFIICSDGVWEALPLEVMEKCSSMVLASKAAYSLACSLRELQTECHDNISFILIS